MLENGAFNDSALIDFVYDDWGRLAEGVRCRTEVAKMEVLSTGKMTIKENGLIKNSDGDYHISFSNVPQEQQKYITQNNAVDSYYTTKELGYSEFESIQNEDKPYIYVVSMNEKAFKKGAYKLIEGRMAQNENEIVIPQHLIDNGRVKINVGDKITLDVGTRELMDGSKQNQKNPYLASSSKEYIYQETGKAGDNEDYEEQIVDGQKKEYTVVGIIERPSMNIEPYTAPGYTAITYEDSKNEINAGNPSNIYITLKNPKEYERVEKQIKETIEAETSQNIDVDVNTDLLRFEGVLSESTLGVLYGIAGVIIVIIVVSSVFVIRNSFSISVSEKTKQYGMLASVGATKKQIRKSVLLEGLYIGIISIPLGILLGIIAIIILLWIVNLLLVDMMEGTSFVYDVPVAAILISIAISTVTIFLSCLIPAIKASRISPIEAIRGTDDIKIKARKVKTSKLTKKLFGIGGVIASKNLKRNRKKYRTTVVSLVVSISIFIALSSFLTYGQMMTGSYYTDLSYNIAVNGGNETLYEKVATWSGIKSYSYSYQTSAEIDVNKYGTDFAKEELENKKQIYEEDFPENVGKYEYNTLGLTIVMVNNDYFKLYVKSLGMNEKDYSNIAILGDDMMHYLGQGKSKVEHYFNVKAGESMEVTMDDEQKQIKISKITTERPMGYESCYTEGGYLFGLFSERPEKEYNNGGPDNLWGMGDNLYYVIECKNESNSTEISKRDCGQLHNSKSWFYKEYGSKFKCIPIIIHRNNKFEKSASPEEDFRILDKDNLDLLKENVQKFAIALCSDISNIDNLDILLKNYNLTKDNFINYYTIKV